ncbi:MAG: D-lyxose/D-mannose family sugar isomerase [Anaerolineae bacterium]|nr:D-lyxose/D-mannose family sugar isomerase [Anaerolineae bacterium]
MKRSEINRLIQDALDFMGSHQFYLPPFAHWSPETWRRMGPEVQEIVQNNLGWDITDFGSGDYENTGLLLFTMRNGHPSNWSTMSGKLYAEKIMVVGVDQVTPMHFHWQKSEDIINRGGGKLMIQLYNATADEDLDDSPVTVSVDGVLRTVAAGDVLALSPGESIALPTRLYHKFWGVESRVLVGEVSMVNDDARDNRFYDATGRFPEIEEDASPFRLLVTDYQDYTQLDSEGVDA